MGEYKYLVIGITEGEEWSKVMSAAEIFNMMNTADCYDIEIDVWRINGYGQALSECSFCGKWHDSKDPQKMVIIGDGIRETGYGTEH